jgi:hypothetical protein
MMMGRKAIFSLGSTRALMLWGLNDEWASNGTLGAAWLIPHTTSLFISALSVCSPIRSPLLVATVCGIGKIKVQSSKRWGLRLGEALDRNKYPNEDANE